MRKILFRGKRIDNGEWVYGYAVKGNDKKGQMFIAKSIGVGFFTGGMTADEVIPETVGQYTGLTDKNGNKIFESDIVKAIQTEYDEDKEKEPIVFEFIGEMIFEDGCFGLRTKHIVDFYAPMWEEEDVKLEVIGNIFDNPELLEVDK